MKLKTIALLTSIAALGMMSSATAQPGDMRFNTGDPDLFLSGEADSCQGCDLSGQTITPPEDEPTLYRNAQLRQADLSNADLSGLDLMGAYLTCADLSGANLSGANLTNVDLIYANLSGADLTGATLSSATLRGAILDANTNLDGVIIDDNTIAPNSQFAEQTGPMNIVPPIPFDNRPRCTGRSF
jgi:Pentapeptide repeats (8 copies)